MRSRTSYFDQLCKPVWVKRSFLVPLCAGISGHCRGGRRLPWGGWWWDSAGHSLGTAGSWYRITPLHTYIYICISGGVCSIPWVLLLDDTVLTCFVSYHMTGNLLDVYIHGREMHTVLLHYLKMQLREWGVSDNGLSNIYIYVGHVSHIVFFIFNNGISIIYQAIPHV